ncbi:MAG: tRNA pseudouridine(38-40) synthase TruA [Coriobacteriia bacterium]|nr:tRNA pseudouridine(38-40) synthase TruA [Coriobacteriia bacterium]
MAGSIVLTLSYDGSGFAGFARQPGLETVQGRVEKALSTVLRRPVETVGAGRTDAGVHALGQVMSFPARGDEPDAHTLLRSLNGLARPGIVVTEVRKASADFSARHSAVAREYRFRIVPGPIPPLFLAGRSWWVKGTLDLAAMRRASAVLVGEHDFRSFCTTESAEGRRTFRHIDLIEITPESQLGEHSVIVRMVGNAFLHSMVRIVVGSLVEVGLGRRSEEWLAEALAARARSAAGPTAPPEGLVLWHVEYPEECWL